MLFFFCQLKRILFAENIYGSFQEEGKYVAYGHDPVDVNPLYPQTYNQIVVDLTTTFTILIGIFFPSVTGKNDD